MATAIACCAMGCSDDEKSINLAQEAAGSYNGYTSARFAYSATPIVTPKETLTIADKGDSKADVTLTSSTWGVFRLTDVPVSAAGNGYAMKGSGTVSLLSGHGAGTYDFTLEGTVEAGRKNPVFVASLSIMGGTTITFQEGDAPACAVVAGSYGGSLSVSVAGEAQGDPVESTVSVAASEDGTSATVTLGSFSIAGMGGAQMTFGDIVVTGVQVTTADYAEYVLSGEVDASVELAGNTIRVSGSVSGTIRDDKSATITFSLTPGAMPVPIVAVFTTAE